MRISCVSLNHHCTPIEVREKVAFDRESGRAFLAELCRPEGVEGILLSTCNRTEVYVAGSAAGEEDPVNAVLSLLHAHRGFEPRHAPPNHWRGEGPAAIRHLLRVAAGLESQVLGESQILGQVKTALEWADEAHSCGKVLRHLWERAIRVGKRVRSETGIGDGARSHAYAALELARKIFGGLADHRVLILGTGEIGGLALEDLEGVPTAGVTVMNRTFEKAEQRARSTVARARRFEELEAALVESDLVITSTGATEPVIPFEMVRRVRSRRGGRRPLLLIDLALPRDVDPRARSIDGVYLKNLDDLAAIVAANEQQRLDAVPDAEAIVEGGVQTFLDWLGALAVEPAIREIRAAFERARAEEVEAARGRVGEEAQAVLEEMSRKLVGRLLHLPSANLRRHDALRDPETLALIRRLFLEEIPHPAATRTEPVPGDDRSAGDPAEGSDSPRARDSRSGKENR